MKILIVFCLMILQTGCSDKSVSFLGCQWIIPSEAESLTPAKGIPIRYVYVSKDISEPIDYSLNFVEIIEFPESNNPNIKLLDFAVKDNLEFRKYQIYRDSKPISRYIQIVSKKGRAEGITISGSNLTEIRHECM